MKCIFLLLIFISAISIAQPPSSFERKIFISRGDSMPYRILLPENFDAAKKYPLVLFLHGAGERGNDNERQLAHGAELFLRDSVRKKYPAIVVFPQCAESSYWSNVIISTNEKNKRTFNFQVDGKPTHAMSTLLLLVKYLEKKYHPGKNRIYAGGLSMGGMGTFELVWRAPKTFAAAFPICGGADIKTAKRISKPAWWIFHGGKDDIVSPNFSASMAAALTSAGADVKLTIYPLANHNSWDSAFAEQNLLPWLFSKTR